MSTPDIALGPTTTAPAPSTASADDDGLDRRIVLATQQGLPLVADPWGEVARRLDVAPERLLERVGAMLARGVIRRIGVVPNHYAVGYVANGMSVWNIDDTWIDEVGVFVGQLPAVTHCYRRPRQLPDWPYNLFAMVHGHSREEVLAEIGRIAEAMDLRYPDACAGRDVLFSSAILKKTGLRLGG